MSRPDSRSPSSQAAAPRRKELLIVVFAIVAALAVGLAVRNGAVNPDAAPAPPAPAAQ